MIRLLDDTPMVQARKAREPTAKKHMRVVLDATHASVVPIGTDEPDASKACTLKPIDMQDGVLDRRSYLAHDSMSTRSIQEVQGLVDAGRALRGSHPARPRRWCALSRA